MSDSSGEENVKEGETEKFSSEKTSSEIQSQQNSSVPSSNSPSSSSLADTSFSTSSSSTSSSLSSSSFPPQKTSGLKIIHTGATGFVGEGVLFAALNNPLVAEVLIVTRSPYLYNNESASKHPSGKLKELVVKDFFNLEDEGVLKQLTGYDACFYCAGKSSVGMSEEDYTRLTYDMVMYFANVLLKLNPGMTMCHISGMSTDSTEKGKAMWARVKGKAENALMRMPFRAVYNFRPGLMKATKGQQHVAGMNKVTSNVLFPVLKLFAPGMSLTMAEIGTAMVNCVVKGNVLHVLEAKDIKAAAKE